MAEREFKGGETRPAVDFEHVAQEKTLRPRGVKKMHQHLV